ncbi:MAG: LON peptidase substrate-binding domain-containing protein, partial [Chloroflexota bacterium]|nr:LON peptidase substrate-binding domain-containing protein [Chloroflexota bacterium]
MTNFDRDRDHDENRQQPEEAAVDETEPTPVTDERPTMPTGETNDELLPVPVATPGGPEASDPAEAVSSASMGEQESTSPERPGEEPIAAIRTLPVLPLRGTVVFPLTVVPLAAAQARSLRLIDQVMSGDRTALLVMQKDAEQEGAGPDDIYRVGTIATIHQMMRVPDGSVRLAVQ